jgi:hypothetical protein
LKSLIVVESKINMLIGQTNTIQETLDDMNLGDESENDDEEQHEPSMKLIEMFKKLGMVKTVPAGEPIPEGAINLSDLKKSLKNDKDESDEEESDNNENEKDNEERSDEEDDYMVVKPKKEVSINVDIISMFRDKSTKDILIDINLKNLFPAIQGKLKDLMNIYSSGEVYQEVIAIKKLPLLSIESDLLAKVCTEIDKRKIQLVSNDKWKAVILLIIYSLILLGTSQEDRLYETFKLPARDAKSLLDAIFNDPELYLK